MVLRTLKTVNIWDKVFKNGPSQICGRQSLKNLKGYGLLNKRNNRGFDKQQKCIR